MTTPAQPLVIGAEIPPALTGRVVAALRAEYPTITAQLGDVDAGNAVVAYLVESILTSHEGKAAQAGAAAELERVSADYQQRAQAARDKARKDAQAIRDAARARGQAIRDRVLGT